MLHYIFYFKTQLSQRLSSLDKNSALGAIQTLNKDQSYGSRFEGLTGRGVTHDVINVPYTS